ncbi:MAG: GNAT family N-acetyltransferase [Chloroflexota bacterium]
MEIIYVDPRSDSRWQQLIQAHASDAFHTPGWLRVLAETYDLEIGAYILLAGTGQPVAGLPFGRIADLKGERLATLPFSDYCDPLVDEPEHWHCLVDRLLADHCPYTLRCLHNDLPLADSRLALVNRAKWHGLNLRPDLDTLWQGLPDTARRAINKAGRQGIGVRLAEDRADLRAFFELHLGMRKYKYRILAQPYRFFEHIWTHLIEKQHGCLLLATHQERVIAGILFLEWKNTLYYKFNASDPAYLSLRPNDLLIWQGIQYGQTRGYTCLDFGLSDWDQEGLVRYKRKFASTEKTISFLRHSPNGASPQAEHLSRLLPQLTDLFTADSVPDHVTEQAGNVLYGLFS